MKLSSPTKITFWIAVLIAVFGVIAQLANIKAVSPYAFWLVVIGFVILVLGNITKGL